MSKTDFLENALLGHQLGKTAYTMPTVHVGLLTAAPSDTTAGTEVTGGAYARVATTGATWNAPAAGATDNAAAITFPTATAAWGTVTHFALYDAATLGNMLRWGALGTSKAVGSGDTISFAAGTLDVTED